MAGGEGNERGPHNGAVFERVFPEHTYTETDFVISDGMVGSDHGIAKAIYVMSPGDLVALQSDRSVRVANDGCGDRLTLVVRGWSEEELGKCLDGIIDEMERIQVITDERKASKAKANKPPRHTTTEIVNPIRRMQILCQYLPDLSEIYAANPRSVMESKQAKVMASKPPSSVKFSYCKAVDNCVQACSDYVGSAISTATDEVSLRLKLDLLQCEDDKGEHDPVPPQGLKKFAGLTTYVLTVHDKTYEQVPVTESAVHYLNCVWRNKFHLYGAYHYDHFTHNVATFSALWKGNEERAKAGYSFERMVITLLVGGMRLKLKAVSQAKPSSEWQPDLAHTSPLQLPVVDFKGATWKMFFPQSKTFPGIDCFVLSTHLKVCYCIQITVANLHTGGEINTTFWPAVRSVVEQQLALKTPPANPPKKVKLSNEVTFYLVFVTPNVACPFHKLKGGKKLWKGDDSKVAYADTFYHHTLTGANLITGTLIKSRMQNVQTRDVEGDGYKFTETPIGKGIIPTGASNN